MRRFDVIVVGAGHAGIEAALASARLGLDTACVTMNLARIGHLPCNCSIGGPAKGHIAREVDALGGQMAISADLATTHIRRVGTGKGPAVQTLRAHVCKRLYPVLMHGCLASEPRLTLIEGAVEAVLSDDRARGVRLAGEDLAADAVVLTTGTFLNGVCHEGSRIHAAARDGDPAAIGLSSYLASLGIRMRRFKTGTTPRVRLSSIDLAPTLVLPSELDAGGISFLHRQTPVAKPLLDCYQTWTNEETHRLLRDNLTESAMYSGRIVGVGPRYCPSVEDKVVRFADKDSHPIFLEIEEWDGESVYVQGFSTSMPREVQLQALRTIPGLADVEMRKPGYAVEYDMADPLQLGPTLMSKAMPGLFLAGQVNGTSGYEEAAGQGIVAGINAARLVKGEPEVVLSRHTSFIGVMIDDLVIKGVDDPYRMLTARAEHRLLLRHDNADRRLTPLSRELGLCSEERWRRYEEKMGEVEAGEQALRAFEVTASDNLALERIGQAHVANRSQAFDLMQRPAFGLAEAADLAASLGRELAIPDDPEVRDQLELAGKYRGYIELQTKMVAKAQKLEAMPIPSAFDYQSLRGLSFESVEKLGRVRPTTVGQASRVPGVRPADVALLIGHLRARGSA